MKENSKNNYLREVYDDVMLPNYAPAYFVPESAKGSRLWDKDNKDCLLYTSPSPRDATLSRMPSSA